MKRLVPALVFAIAAQAAAGEQRPQADIDVAAAIARGAKKKAGGLELTEFAIGTTNGFRIQLHTPATWIQSRAAAAAEKYQAFTAADVTDDDRADVLRVIAYPDTPRTMDATNMASSVKHVVIRDVSKKDAAQPLVLEPFDDSVGNKMGATLTYAGARATFSMRDVERMRAADPKGEFLVTVVGTNSEKDFRVKQKHFDDLSLTAPKR